MTTYMSDVIIVTIPHLYEEMHISANNRSFFAAEVGLGLARN